MKLIIFLILVGLFLYWRRNRGRSHGVYFLRLQELLHKRGVSHPRLIIDLDRLDNNIARAKEHVGDTSKVRVVAKSLPCFELLQYIQEQLQTNRLMVFHQPFLVQQMERFPKANFLIGKPLPVAAVRKTLELSEQYMQWGSERVQWLVDSVPRVEQYQRLAQEKQLKLRITIELDIGLHRGGVETLETARSILLVIAEHSQSLTFSGFMGYEPHIGKIPDLLKSQREPARLSALNKYQAFVDLVRNEFPSSVA